jgi:aspartyl-tRNA(Asn)/glutamyl-tRNA(Gln) amidotransferase subunit A
LNKKIELWSISDYKHAFFTDQVKQSDFWKAREEKLVSDPYNAFISLFITDRVNKKEDSRLLSGVPIALKDNICTSDLTTTCASKMLEHWTPRYDASVVNYLKSEDSYIIGKTNLDEFAMGNTTETSYFGRSYNPWDPNKRFTPGGSSGGSAIAVTQGYVPVAIGSDTGGSIRCPASFCGVLGLKPTYGRVSRYGLVSYAHSLDQIGILARYAQDMTLVLETISQPDFKDMTYQNKGYKTSDLTITDEIKVGIAQKVFDFIPKDQAKLIKNALCLMDEKGLIKLIDIEFDDIDILLPTYYVTSFSEAYSNLARYTGQQYGFDGGSILATRLQGFSKEVQRRFNLGSFSLKSGFEEQLYLKSQKIRSHYKEKLRNIFTSIETIALPTMLDVAYKWDEIKSPIDSYKADLLTVPANLTGIPALTIPVGFSSKKDVKMPVGLQLFGSWWQEHTLIQIAYEYQQLTKHHLQLPPDLLISEKSIVEDERL